MDLFEHQRRTLEEKEAPLAARMRPRTLDEFAGQGGIVGPGRLLRRAIHADQLGSLIFYGPPGTGKTTLARIIANTTKAEFIGINAVLSGVKEIRGAIERAKRARAEYARRTILFVDEVHRFNKAQQDALLPWVENGTVVLVGATTENPYFEVNKALVSRSRIFRLEGLEAEDLRQVARRALADEERGYGGQTVEVEPEALEHLVNVANGDARALLNALELAVETTPPVDGVVRVDLAVAEESIQRRAVLYDKEGDTHFDAISAFIKSCRGSDPDAALYWLARMVYAGEDPRFLFRRMIILASEDVGLADPDALPRVMACAQAFDRVGLPEGRYHLSQAALVLATAPKSNSTMGFFEALKAVGRERDDEVPNHLKDSSRDKKGFGHGLGYLYPHAYRDHWVAQQYLPGGLVGQVFYEASSQGYEGGHRELLAQRREAQLAGASAAPPGPAGLTWGAEDRSLDRWVRRASSGAGARLAGMRERLFEVGQVDRHHVVMELGARTGLLSWEALRRAPEGGVICCVCEADGERRASLFDSLSAQIESLGVLQRPSLLECALPHLRMAPGVAADRVLGHDVLSQWGEALEASAGAIAAALAPGGRLVLEEAPPAGTQRLSALVDGDLEDLQAWAEAEERIYAEGPGSLGLDAIVAALEGAGFELEVTDATVASEVHLTPRLIERWWSGDGRRKSYRDWLLESLSAERVTKIETWARARWRDQRVRWRSERVLLVGRLRP